jgi:hypothetical protein
MADWRRKLEAGRARHGDGPGDAVSDCLRDQGRLFPLFFWLPASYHTPPVAVSAVFAGLLTKVGVYALIRVFTLIFVGDTGFTAHADPGHRRGDDGDRRARRGGPVRVPPHPVVPHHQPDRLHDPRPRAGRADEFPGPGDVGAGRLGLLHHAPHHREDEPVPGQRRGLPTGRLVRAEGTGRPLSQFARVGHSVPDSRVVPGRDAAPLRLLRQALAGPGRARDRTVCDRRRRTGGRAADPLFDDQDLGGGVLEKSARCNRRDHRK